MKTSAIKIVRSLFDKKNIIKLKKFINKKNLIISPVFIGIVVISYYFFKPTFFDYETNKEVLEKKINDYLKIETKIEGDISYHFFPKPRVVAKGIKINFEGSGKEKIKFEETNFLISIFKLKSLEEFEIKKVFVEKQKVKIFSSQFYSYLEYFQKYNINNFVLKNCEILFRDDLNNDILISNINLKNIFKNNKKKIIISGLFANNKFKIDFLNEKNKEKFLDLSIPNLNTNLKIIFSKESNLDTSSGKLNLKILNNVLLLNFDGDKNYKISDSFFRNKFLNSKLHGVINFKENFYFDINSEINQINLRKLFLYYQEFLRDRSSGQFNISKKINGKFAVNLKKTDSYMGKINNTKFDLLFENGDLKIKSGSANIGDKSKFKFNISILGRGKDQKIIFFVNFLSSNGKKFLKNFNVISDEDNISFNSIGKINIIDKKIRFENLVLNNQRITQNNIEIIEMLFNKNIIEDDILGLLDFFKVKKFINDASENLE